METNEGGVTRANEVPGNEVMMAYGGAAGAAMGPSTSCAAEVLGSTADYSPPITPTSLAGPVEVYAPVSGPSTYSPRDSPAGAVVAATNGQIASFGFTQEQVACVCEVPVISIHASLNFPKVLSFVRKQT